MKSKLDNEVRKKIEKAKDANSNYLNLNKCYELSEIPYEITFIKLLNQLELRGLLQKKGNIREIPVYLQKLQYLRKLYLSNNRINQFSSVLCRLSELEELLLDGNEISSLPDELSLLQKLYKLDISNNKFEILSGKIADLNNLIHLNISENKLVTLPSKIGNLDRLVELYCGNNEISSLPPEIGRLSSLETLYLNNNNLSYLPKKFRQLTSLKILNLDENNFVELPEIIGDLADLRYLSVVENNLRTLPSEITKLENLERLDLKGNGSLIHPPLEIANQGLDAIRRWFISIEKEEDVIRLYEAKLILIGNGEVGKTTIRENLIDRNYKVSYHPSTHGLEVKNWEIQVALENKKNVIFTFNIWDFGGQGKYRSVQQFFCSRNSLYLFITEPNDEINHEDDKYVGFPYWLSFINAFGTNREENHKSPVIYVLNKKDLPGVSSIEKDKQIKGFDQIKDFLEISCKTGEGFSELESAIKKSLKETGMVGLAFNKNWVRVKEILEDRKENYILIHEYYNICLNNGLEKTDANIWLNYLNSIGTVLYFAKTYKLKRYVILNPNWARILAYKMLDSPLVINRFGVFSDDDIDIVFSGEVNVDFALELLETFELCYKTEKENRYEEIKRIFSVPALFKVNKPENYYDFSKLGEPTIQYMIQFEEFIPAGMLSRLMVRKSSWIAPAYKNWQSGVVFERWKERKLDTVIDIVELWKENKIIANFYGESSLEMLVVISSEFNEIKNRLEKEKNLFSLRKIEKIWINNKEIDIDQVLNKINTGVLSYDEETGKVINNTYISGGSQQFANIIHNNTNYNDPSFLYGIEQIMRKVIDEKMSLI